MTKTPQTAALLTELFRSALHAVNGKIAVERYLKNNEIQGLVAVIAIGKAAAAMMSGAEKCLTDQIHSALIVTKEGHCDPSLGWPCYESGHPVPDQRSLDCGTKLLEFISKIPPDIQLLALISGGASALVEVLPDNMVLRDLQELNEWLLASGLAIDEMNRVRQSVSKIKGGKLLSYLTTHNVTQLLISDVRNDEPASIGSGLFVVSAQQLPLPRIPGKFEQFLQPPAPGSAISVSTYIVANNEMACQAVIEQARSHNREAINHGQTLYGDVFDIVASLLTQLKEASKGIHVWGGEPTLVLPELPGQGGRNQSLALALAIGLQGSVGITVLVAATDGTDGPTEDAGAIVDGETLLRGEAYPGYAKERLVAADAGTFLAAAGALVSTGPTGTNVMDLVIAIKD